MLPRSAYTHAYVHDRIVTRGECAQRAYLVFTWVMHVHVCALRLFQQCRHSFRNDIVRVSCIEQLRIHGPMSAHARTRVHKCA